jgi:polyisoprenyl-teichoic acid--peptidoglycan teichoic acid transferase
VRSFLKIAGVVFLLVISAGAGAGVALLSKWSGTNPLATLGSLPQLMMDPAKFFPGQDRITVLCLGLDRNILISRDPKKNGMPYTTGARSDVMMIASLDLKNKTVSILSIPRDTRVKLPGKRSYAKINQAHADGGIPYTRQAVEEFLGISVDHHVVIKQEAIEEVVKALGGVRLNVEKDMDYDDNWGQLHIHLKQGEQKLDGKQVVGYMRFRHDAEGDFGRIRRQQQVIQALAGQVKSPTVLLKASKLIEAIHAQVRSDLTPEQQLALAHLFHKIDVSNLQTAQLPVADTVNDGKVSYVIPDESKKEAVVDWVINGNRDAMNRLIRVELKNASGDRELYQQVYKYLRHCGFEVWRSGRAVGDPAPATRVVQRSGMRGSGRRVLEALGLGGNVEKSEDRGSDVTLYVGRDLQQNATLAFAKDWPEPEEAAIRAPAPEPRRVRRPRRSREPVIVKIRTVEEPEPEEAPEPEEKPQNETAPDAPGTADPGSSTPPAAPAPSPASTPPPTPSTAPGTGTG